MCCSDLCVHWHQGGRNLRTPVPHTHTLAHSSTIHTHLCIGVCGTVAHTHTCALECVVLAHWSSIHTHTHTLVHSSTLAPRGSLHPADVCALLTLYTPSTAIKHPRAATFGSAQASWAPKLPHIAQMLGAQTCSVLKPPHLNHFLAPHTFPAPPTSLPRDREGGSM